MYLEHQQPMISTAHTSHAPRQVGPVALVTSFPYCCKLEEALSMLKWATAGSRKIAKTYSAAHPTFMYLM